MCYTYSMIDHDLVRYYWSRYIAARERFAQVVTAIEEQMNSNPELYLYEWEFHSCDYGEGIGIYDPRTGRRKLIDESLL